MQRKFCVAFHEPGTLAGDLNIRWTAPSDCTLVHVSAVASDANAFGITIGDSADADEYLAKSDSGVSGTPAEFDGTDFLDTDGNSHSQGYFPRIVDGTVVVIGIDHDYNGGGSGADSDDLTVVLTFLEG